MRGTSEKTTSLKRALILFDVLVICVVLLLSAVVIVAVGMNYVRKLIAERDGAHLVWIDENISRNYYFMEGVAFSVAIDEEIRGIVTRNVRGENYSDGFSEMHEDINYLRQKFSNLAETFNLRIDSATIFLDSTCSSKIIPEINGVVYYDTELRWEQSYLDFLSSEELISVDPTDVSTAGNRYYGHELSPEMKIDGEEYNVVSLTCKLQDYAATEIYGVIRVNVRTQDFFSEVESVYGDASSFCFKIFSGDKAVYSNAREEKLRFSHKLDKFGLSIRYGENGTLHGEFIVQILVSLIPIAATGIIVTFLTVIFFRKLYRDVFASLESVGKNGVALRPSRFLEINRYRDKLDGLVKKIDSLTKERYELEKKQQQAKILSLQYQINPHFLFNMLEVFRARADASGDEAAAETISNFADIMRYNISATLAVSTIAQEVDIAVNFIGLFRFRYGDALKIDTDVDESLNDMPVMKFLLQPIVENAVKHGKKRGKTMHIFIRVVRLQDNVIITVENDGAPVLPERLKEIREKLSSNEESTDKIGLKNVYDRIRLYYEGRGEFTIDSQLEKTTVTIILPFDDKEEI